MPITWFAEVVGKRENTDGVRHLENATWYGKLLTGALRAGTSAATTGTRGAAWGHRAIRSSAASTAFEELNAEARSLAFVPDRGFFKFGGGFGL